MTRELQSERVRIRVLTSVEVASVLSLRDHVASVSTDFGFETSSLANDLKPVLLFIIECACAHASERGSSSAKKSETQQVQDAAQWPNEKRM